LALLFSIFPVLKIFFIQLAHTLREINKARVSSVAELEE